MGGNNKGSGQPPSEGGDDPEEWKSDDIDFAQSNPIAEYDFSGNPMEQANTEEQESTDNFDGSSRGAKAPPAPRSKMAPFSNPGLAPGVVGSKPDLSNPAFIPLICGVTGVSYMVKGFLAGFVFGAGQGILEGAQLGLIRSPGFARALGVASVQSGASMSVWLATYSATHCAAQLYRGKSDLVNTMAGGMQPFPETPL